MSIGRLALVVAPLLVCASVASAQGVAVPEPSELAVRYHRTGILVWLLGTLWGFAIPLVFLFTGLSARIRTLSHRIGRRWLMTLAVYVALYGLATAFLDLPRACYVDFVRPHSYGLSNQTFSKWLGDAGKTAFVNLAIGLVVTSVVFFLIERSPRRWWLHTALLAVPFVCGMLLVGPIWIDPLFNRFGPMKDKALEARILALASRAGIEGGRVFEVDKSADTRMLDAYVAGLGRTKRIVLWDTLVAGLDSRELLAVMGHEMGHYRLGHAPKFIALASAVIFVTLFLVHLTAHRAIQRFRRRFGFDRLADPAALPLLVVLVQVFFLAAGPLVLGYRRHLEHEADRFSLDLTQDNAALARAFVKFERENLTVPRPHRLAVLLWSSHPPLADRIEFANTYRPLPRRGRVQGEGP